VVTFFLLGVLLPTAVLLLVLPVINRPRLQVGVVPVAASVIFLTIAVQVGLQHSTSLDRSVLSFGAGFPVMPTVCTGLMGFLFGVALKRFNLRKDIVLKSAIPPVAFVLLTPFHHSQYFSALIFGGFPAAHVFLLCAISTAILFIPKSPHCKGAFGIIGRYSLFCFLGHRVIMNVVVLLGRDLRIMNPELIYEWSMRVTFSTLGLLCWFRTTHTSFDHACKRLYI
jgi:hypothetical protein